MRIEVPIRLVSESNMREHWKAKWRRKREQQGIALAYLARLKLPIHWMTWSITLTRIGKRRLDPGNLEASFKHVQDAVAEWLGIDDGDARLTWRYEQTTGKEYGVEVEITERAAT